MTEILLQWECNDLAIELTERYEELNLIYSTNDSVESYQAGREALKQLVANCSEHLGVGCAVLICRNLDLLIFSDSYKPLTADQDEILSLLRTSVYDYVETHMTSVVINGGDDTSHTELRKGHDEKFIACPILLERATPIGMLAVVTKSNAQEFSNSDVNLLRVMARKAARIVDTHHDSLTGLVKRSGFEYSISKGFEDKFDHGATHCILHLDIDQLHIVNDTVGYHEGDNLLRRVAKIIHSIVRSGDVCARLGGDTFGIFLPNCDLTNGRGIATKIANAIDAITVVSDTKELSVTVGIGIAAITQNSEGGVKALAEAAAACKMAKERGGCRIEVMNGDDTAILRRLEEVEWVGKIQKALRNNRFVLHCQPEEPTKEWENPAHFEILVRLLDDDGSVLSPAKFIPTAERYHLMHLVDKWVVTNALDAIGQKWVDISIAKPVFSINLSGQSFTSSGFAEFLKKKIAESGISPQNICFEITETAAISNIEEALVFIDSMKSIGCRFALDDFGAGLSSFGYLRNLPVDYLKIDGSLIREITSDIVALAMVSSICQIGQTMGLSLIAEFVGDEATRSILRKVGVDFMQGFLIGRPVPLQETLEQLASSQSSAAPTIALSISGSARDQ